MLPPLTDGSLVLRICLFLPRGVALSLCVRVCHLFLAIFFVVDFVGRTPNYTNVTEEPLFEMITHTHTYIYIYIGLRIEGSKRSGGVSISWAFLHKIEPKHELDDEKSANI